MFISVPSEIQNHHHHVLPLARISLTRSRHFSLSFIASSRSSRLHPESSHSCCMYVRAGRPAFARLYVGVHRSTSLMSSSLLLQQCPECLVCLSWIVFVMGGRWPYIGALWGVAARTCSLLLATFLCKGGCLRGVMVEAMDCGIVVSEFVLQSRYYVHFRANTLGKGMKPLILPAMGWIAPLLLF